MSTPICTDCSNGKLHVCPRETNDACEWCSCTPAVRYVRLAAHGGSSEDWITICTDCRDALLVGLKLAVRRR